MDGAAIESRRPPQQTEPGDSALLAARGVSRRYGRRVALEPIDLDVRSGETVFLVGPNGAGKSTLLAILAGAVPATSGRVVGTLPPREVGWAPQRPAQYRHLSARENLVLFARLQGVPEPEAETERLLQEFGVPDDGRQASQLSVGNQQRLNLALCFLGRPRVLLLDEPTASLDPRQSLVLWQRLERARRDGAGIVVATHLLEETVHADQVLVLEEGRVVFTGSPDDFRANVHLA